MTTPSLPKPAADAFEESPAASADFLLAGRHVSTAQHIAGLLNAGLLETAGTPRELPRYTFSDVDPDLVQEIWNAGAAVGFYAGQVTADPGRRRKELMRLQESYRQAAYEAMGGMVARSLRLVSAAHPVDAEEIRGH